MVCLLTQLHIWRLECIFNWFNWVCVKVITAIKSSLDRQPPQLVLIIKPRDMTRVDPTAQEPLPQFTSDPHSLLRQSVVLLKEVNCLVMDLFYFFSVCSKRIFTSFFWCKMIIHSSIGSPSIYPLAHHSLIQPLIYSCVHLQKLYRRKPGMLTIASKLPQNLSKNRYRDVTACESMYTCSYWWCRFASQMTLQGFSY